MKNKFTLLLITICCMSIFLVDSASAGRWRSCIASVVAIKTVKKQAVPPLPQRVEVIRTRQYTSTRFYTCTGNKCSYKVIRRRAW